MITQYLFVPSTGLVEMALWHKGKPYAFVDNNVSKLVLRLESLLDGGPIYEFDSDQAGQLVSFDNSGRITLKLGTQAIAPGDYDMHFSAWGSQATEAEVLVHPILRRSSGVLVVIAA